MQLLRKHKQFDDFRLLLPELLNEVLSHLTLKDLSILSRTCTWLHDRIAHLRVIVHVERPLLIDSPQAFLSRPSFCSYAYVRRKLNQQMRHQRKELEKLYETLCAIVLLALIVLGPMAGGFLMQLCGLDVFSRTLGVSSSALGTLTGAGILAGLVNYMLWQPKHVSPASHPSCKKSEKVVGKNATISAIQKL